MSVRLGCANEGERVRALDGIDRDPLWQAFHPAARPIPGEVYVVESAGFCRKEGCPCGGKQRLYFLKGLLVEVASINHETGSWAGNALKDEWFTIEGARLH